MTVSIGRKFNETEGDLEGFQDCASESFNTSETKTLQCKRNIIGQYVSIQLNDMGILSLCEVQVHGEQISGKFRISLDIYFKTKRLAIIKDL